MVRLREGCPAIATGSTGPLSKRDAPGLSATPVSPSERIATIDVLRGLSLFGVLAINLVTEFRVSIFERFLPVGGAVGPLDRAVEAFLMVAVDSKAFALFSFLFGVGLAIQFDRLAGSARRMVLLVRRLIVLLAIGLAHLFLIWNGDILAEYALAGFIVLPFLFGPRWLLAVSAAVVLGCYLVMPLLPPVVSLPDAAWMTNHVAEATRAYGTGGFLDVLEFRIREVPSICLLHVFVFPRTVALFLFGAFIWRIGVFGCAAANRRLLFGIATVGIFVGAGLALATQGRVAYDWPSLGRAHDSVERLATVLSASGYAAAVIGLVSLPNGHRMLAWAAPIGRMAFTNYLAQSLILGWIFYGYGLGLFGRLGPAAALMIGIAVYAAQAVFSAWWLGRFRFGPVEWFWRTLMYGVPHPMRQP
jgi:uncharacterized protein